MNAFYVNGAPMCVIMDFYVCKSRVGANKIWNKKVQVYAVQYVSNNHKIFMCVIMT